MYLWITTSQSISSKYWSTVCSLSITFSFCVLGGQEKKKIEGESTEFSSSLFYDHEGYSHLSNKGLAFYVVAVEVVRSPALLP